MKYRDMMIALSVVGFGLMWGCESDGAGREAVFPDNLSLSEQAVELNPAETRQVVVVHGNGRYTAESDDPEIALAKADGEMVAITGVSPGKAHVIVTDSKGIGNFISVWVYGDIQLEAYEIDVSGGDRTLGLPAVPAKLKVLSGNGNYTVTSDGDADFTVAGDEIVIEAYQFGEFTATVMDRTGRTIDFTITSTDPYEDFKTSTDDLYYYEYEGMYLTEYGDPSDEIRNGYFVYNINYYNNSMVYELRIPVRETLSVGQKQDCQFFYVNPYGGTNAGTPQSPISVNAVVLKNKSSRVWIVFFNDDFNGRVNRPVLTP